MQLDADSTAAADVRLSLLVSVKLKAPHTDDPGQAVHTCNLGDCVQIFMELQLCFNVNYLLSKPCMTYDVYFFKCTIAMLVSNTDKVDQVHLWQLPFYCV